MNTSAPASAFLDTLLDALLSRRDEETVRALFEARIRRRHRRQQSDAQLSFVFGWGKKPDAQPTPSDDARFMQAMSNFDALLQRAMERKRAREAIEEERRSTASKRARKTGRVNEDSVKGRVLATARQGGQWTIGGFVTTIGCTVTAARVFAHELAKQGLLIREKRGLYKAAPESEDISHGQEA